jgi:hypothetical protein
MSTARRSVTVATVVAAVALILGVPAISEARQVEGIEIVFANGRVSVTVGQAAANQVLAEWSRVGQTDIVGAELPDERIVTDLKLEDVSESEALEAILGQSFGFVQLLRDPEPGLSSIRRLVIGAVAAPTDEEKQDKKDKKEKKPKKIKDWDPSLPPEVQFDYFVPDKVASGEVFPPPVYEPLVVPAPETRFDYIVPEKAVGDFGVPDYTPMDPNRPVPE